MRKRLAAAGAACIAGIILAAPSAQQAVAASTVTAWVIPCDGLQTWTFSTPLTLAFTTGTITETWNTPDTCNEFFVADTLGQVPFESGAVISGSNPGLDEYSGSCVVAAATIEDLYQNGLLVGGVVMVEHDSTAPGETHAEVDVVATTSPCDESSASGADAELRTITVVGK